MQTDGRTKEKRDTILVEESTCRAIHVTGTDKTRYKVKGKSHPITYYEGTVDT
jgi:hypothetical protein